jgi:hypothetical protein
LHKVYFPWILFRSKLNLFEFQSGSSLVPKAEAPPQSSASEWALIVLAWLPVTIPLLWGIWQTVKKAAVLFK